PNREGRTRALDGSLRERQNLLYGSRSRRKSHGNARLRRDFCARRGVGRERYREVSSTPARPTAESALLKLSPHIRISQPSGMTQTGHPHPAASQSRMRETAVIAPHSWIRCKEQ